MTAAELEAAVERLLDDRERQGLPRHVTDPAVLDLIAGIVLRALARQEGR